MENETFIITSEDGCQTTGDVHTILSIGEKKSNEDSYIYSQRGTDFMAVVADGMGSNYFHGKAASQLLCSTFGLTFGEHGNLPARELIQNASNITVELFNAQTDILGTTMVCAARIGKEVAVASLGDSTVLGFTDNGHLIYQSIPDIGHSGPSKYYSNDTPNMQDWKTLMIDSLGSEVSHIVLCTDGVTDHCSPACLASFMERSINLQISFCKLVDEFITDRIKKDICCHPADNYTLIHIELKTI